ncbi:MAG: putative selenate ABC transporter substrate-binding protein [Nitrosomonadales bacterium]|nr:putative selenate ABC transporter substrate-binding protein [Nitrosomonadales bacterium]
MQNKDTFIRLRNLFISLAIFAGLIYYASTYSEPVLRVSIFSDESSIVVRRKLKPLTEYLEKKVGMKIEFRPMPDGETMVEALTGNKLDMVWLDGYYFIRAKVRSADQVIPLVQRAEDERTTSVFITRRVDITRLEDLKGRTLAFGAETSASGHLMPRSFLREAYLDPDTDMKPLFSGSPDATVAAVAGGQADAGVLSSAAWEKLIEQGKADPRVIRVFYVTPGYHDYNWTVRADMDVNLRIKLSDAFLALDRNIGQDREILEFQRASRFITTHAENYAAIEAAARRAGLIP